VEVADGLLKEAPVEVHFATPVQPGKYLVLFSGPVEAVAAAGRRGGELAGGDLVDRLHLPQAHPQLLAGLRRRGGVIQGRLDAIAVLETSTVASALAAADLALKTANVDLLDLRVANGLGGKSFFTLTGEVSDVRAALTAAARQAEAGGHLLRQVVIAQPHPELVRHL
jgi:microcompartment protein CcmL/EutN